MASHISIINILLIAFTIAFYAMYFRHREPIRMQGYARAGNLIIIGISVVFISCLLDVIYFIGLKINPESLQLLAFSQLNRHTGVWICLLIGAPLLFVGLTILANQIFPKFSEKIVKLEETSAELWASNDKLTRKLTTRNRELEASNNKLREVLREQQVSRLALLQSEKKFRTLFDESPAIFASINENHTLTDINLHGAKFLGFDSITLVGKPITKIIAPDDQTLAHEFIDHLFTSKKKQDECEFRLLHKNLSHIWVKITGGVITEAGNAPYLLMVCQDISKIKNLEKTLIYRTSHDNTTGLFNRHALEEHLSTILKIRSDHAADPLALIYIDVDLIKVINDTCGHLAGDELLRQLAIRFKDTLPQCDCFARMGGDEYVIVKNHSNKEEAIELAEIVRNVAEDYIFVWREKSYRLSVSIGVTISSRSNNTITTILGAADSACTEAKDNGRNRVCFYEDNLAEEFNDNRKEMMWVNRLQEALTQDRFELYFQPIMRLGASNTRYVHYEVLIRYVDDAGDHIGPDAFLPAAERYGLSEQLDLWVLTTALDYLSRNPNHTRTLGCCSINLTANTLASHRARSAIRQIIGAVDFSTNKICFEITETNAIQNLSEVVEFIRELKIMGCKFALDDFGTGFSSFGYLKHLDVDYIKIDGSFIRDIITDKIDRSIVTAINTIGENLGIHIIAEYVEHELIEKELITLGIPLGQGYGLSKPAPISNINNFYFKR